MIFMKIIWKKSSVEVFNFYCLNLFAVFFKIDIAVSFFVKAGFFISETKS